MSKQEHPSNSTESSDKALYNKEEQTNMKSEEPPFGQKADAELSENKQPMTEPNIATPFAIDEEEVFEEVVVKSHEIETQNEEVAPEEDKIVDKDVIAQDGQLADPIVITEEEHTDNRDEEQGIVEEEDIQKINPIPELEKRLNEINTVTQTLVMNTAGVKVDLTNLDNKVGNMARKLDIVDQRVNLINSNMDFLYNRLETIGKRQKSIIWIASFMLAGIVAILVCLLVKVLPSA